VTKLVSIIVVTFDNRTSLLKNCLASIFDSSYKNYEVIVVDNASDDNTRKMVKERYENKVRFIRSGTNLMAGGGRNLGSASAKGEYFLFIDDDNIIDRNMIGELVKGMNLRVDVGMVGPLMFYLTKKNTIWWAGSAINLLSSHTTYVGIGETERGQYNEVSEVGHIPNVFMIKKEVWNKVGGIDQKYIIHYEESDLAERIRRSGYKIYRIPSTKTFHAVQPESENKIRNYVGQNSEKTYYTARNRILFMNKFASRLNFILFLLLFNNLFLFFYFVIFFKSKKLSLIKNYLRGYFDGIKYVFSAKLDKELRYI